MASLTMGECSLYEINNASDLINVSVGDLIEFPREVYSHWAVYVGPGQVIHLAGVGNDGVNANSQSVHMFSICGVLFSKAEVRIDDFWKVAAGSKAYKNNTKDTEWRHLSTAEIIRNATSQLGKVGYNLLYLNCEHFAKWCRYGKASSEQVDQVLTGVGIGLTAGLAGGLIGAGVGYLFDKEDEKKKKRQKKS